MDMPMTRDGYKITGIELAGLAVTTAICGALQYWAQWPYIPALLIGGVVGTVVMASPFLWISLAVWFGRPPHKDTD